MAAGMKPGISGREHGSGSKRSFPLTPNSHLKNKIEGDRDQDDQDSEDYGLGNRTADLHLLQLINRVLMASTPRCLVKPVQA